MGPLLHPVQTPQALLPPLSVDRQRVQQAALAPKSLTFKVRPTSQTSPSHSGLLPVPQLAKCQWSDWAHYAVHMLSDLTRPVVNTAAFAVQHVLDM